MNEVLTTASAEIIYQITAIVISIVTTIVGTYLKNWLKASSFNKEYNLYNERVERILDNAVHYAEIQMKNAASRNISKKQYAFKWLQR